MQYKYFNKHFPYHPLLRRKKIDFGLSCDKQVWLNCDQINRKPSVKLNIKQIKLQSHNTEAVFIHFSRCSCFAFVG